jgi:HlyD family secretion protein
MKMLRLSWRAAVCLTLVLGGAYACDTLRPAGAPVEVTASAVAERRDLVVNVEASGTLEALRTIEVKSRASGELRAVLVESGDLVEVGMLLAEVDPRDVRNALDQADADLESARVKLETAMSQLNRMEELKEIDAVTAQEYESALDAASSARTGVVRAETNRALAYDKMGDVTIRAPITGTVIERTVETGQIIASATGNVSGGTTLLKLADLTAMRVRMLVDETDIGQVTRGTTARVTAQAFPGRTFVGVVEKLEPQAVVNQNVTMFPVLVSLPNPEGLLKPGMNAQVAIEVARRANVLAISIEAVVAMREVAAVAKTLGVTPEAVSAMGEGESASGGQAGADEGRAAVVFIEKPTGLEPRLVRVGLSDWEYTEVLSGLEEGESVRLVNTTPPSEQEPGGFGGAGARQGGAP